MTQELEPGGAKQLFFVTFMQLPVPRLSDLVNRIKSVLLPGVRSRRDRESVRLLRVIPIIPTANARV